MEYRDQSSIGDDLGLLTGNDIDFIQGCLGEDVISRAEVCAVLNDWDIRFELLDSLALYDAVCAGASNLSISEYFYYWIVVRQAALAADLKNPVYADNIAAAFIKLAHMQRKAVDREFDPAPRYFPVRLAIRLRPSKHGYQIKIMGSIEPYQMMLEGYHVVDESEVEVGVDQKPLDEKK